MDDLRRLLLHTAFPAGVPDLVHRLVLPTWDPHEFGGGPILSSTGAHRFYVADQTDSPAFTTAVLSAVPGSGPMLQTAAPNTRRMIDTDGIVTDLYLDDLHLGIGNGTPSDGDGDSDSSVGPVMCKVFHHPSGARSHICFLEKLPPDLAHLAPLWGEGRLLRRLGDRRSVLWVTEARWTGRAKPVARLAAATLALPAEWATLCEDVPGAYIDGIELHPDGRVDLTPGVLR